MSPDLPVSPAALLSALAAQRYNGDVILSFRNGDPVLARLVNADRIPLASPADGRPRPPRPAPPLAPSGS